MQFQCLVVNPQSGIAVLFYMVSSHQHAMLCLKVARQLNTRSFWSVRFWLLSLFVEVDPAMHKCQGYFSSWWFLCICMRIIVLVAW